MKKKIRLLFLLLCFFYSVSPTAAFEFKYMKEQGVYKLQIEEEELGEEMVERTRHAICMDALKRRITPPLLLDVEILFRKDSSVEIMQVGSFRISDCKNLLI